MRCERIPGLTIVSTTTTTRNRLVQLGSESFLIDMGTCEALAQIRGDIWSATLWQPCARLSAIGCGPPEPILGDDGRSGAGMTAT
jgi:hypothetical protein